MKRNTTRPSQSVWAIAWIVTILLLAGCGGKASKSGAPSAGTTSTASTAEALTPPPTTDPVLGELPPPPPAPANAYPAAPDANEGGGGNNTLATATALTVGTSLSANIFPAGDSDFFALSLTAGTAYEISVRDLCATCDSIMELQNGSGVVVANNDDYPTVGFTLSSRILYTPTTTGTYYVVVRGFTAAFQISYTLSSRVFSDGDGDGYTVAYDCNDADNTIYLNAPETTDDGVDQNCDGFDELSVAAAASTPDAFEPDDTTAQAGSLGAIGGLFAEVSLRSAYLTAGRRTLTASGGVSNPDVIQVTVPAGEVYEYAELGSMNNAYTLIDSDGTTTLTPTYGTYWFGLLFPNTAGTTAKTFYLKVDAAVAGDSGQYVPVVWSLGTDKDGDGYLSRNWGDADCNDNDAAIHPLATDPVDTVDQNCDGTL